MRVRILLSLILTVFFASSSIANVGNKEKSAYQVDVQLNSENKIVVRYISDDVRKVKILVLDSNGNIMSKKKFSKNGHVKFTYDITHVLADQLIFKVLANNKTVCVERVNVNKVGLASIPVPVKINNSENKTQQDLLTESK